MAKADNTNLDGSEFVGEIPGLEPQFTVPQLQAWSLESESCWRKRISRKEIRITKFGANTRISKSALDEWIARSQGGRK